MNLPKTIREGEALYKAVTGQDYTRLPDETPFDAGWRLGEWCKQHVNALAPRTPNIIEESIAGVDVEGKVVTNWATAARAGLLGAMERVDLTSTEQVTVHAVVCTDGSRYTLPRPLTLVPDSTLRFGASVGSTP